MEIIGKLEIQCGVVNFLHLHFFNVFTGSGLVRILLVIGNSSSGDDGPEIESFTKLLPGIVEPSAQTKAAVIGMDKYVDPIQDISFRVVGVKGIVAGNLVVGVPVGKFPVIDDDGQRACQNLSVRSAEHTSELQSLM